MYLELANTDFYFQRQKKLPTPDFNIPQHEISKGILSVCLLEVSFLGFHCKLTKSFWLVNSQCGFYQITKFDISYVHSM
jgi:transposase